MPESSILIYVYAHWREMKRPELMGQLAVRQIRDKKAISFEYDSDWITSGRQFTIDPDISWFTGKQFPGNKENFGIFLDSMPDTWGRMLLKRKEILRARVEKRKVRNLYEVDFLLGVFDESRMGGIRFKLDPEGPFLDNSQAVPVPPWSSVRELQHGVRILESDHHPEENKWLMRLLAPGSSLGGARPKANILDAFGHPWIAKFPSKNDTTDMGAWEYVCNRLAQKAGIIVPETKIEKVAGKYHTFFAKRFDRDKGERIHFASAMTMTGNTEHSLRDNPASYLEIAEFLHYCGSNQKDLDQLWRRIAFNICVSNTDDHLRNHGFLLQNDGWALSPAFDMNPSIDRDGLALNIDMENNSLDIDIAVEVGDYFKLDKKRMDKIIAEVKRSVKTWPTVAKEVGISRQEQELMREAFKD